MMTAKPQSIDEYIAGFPEEVQRMLEQVRASIRKAAPTAAETIKYGMPTFTFNGNLVYFAAWKKHIGFYPAPTGNDAFKKDLAIYKTSKGTVQFPLDQPMPLRLVTKIVKFRMQEQLKKRKKET